MNPYETLGVANDAPEPDIKAAYRSKAKRAHPDAGGDREAFEELNRAYRVLVNPKARARFDETGEIEDEGPDANTQALGYLAGVFDAVFAGIVQSGADYRKVNVVELMYRHIDGDVQKRAAQRAKVTQDLPKWQDMLDRFSTDDDQPNRLAGFIENNIRQIRAIEANYDHEDEVAGAAIRILADHRYRTDPEEPITFVFGSGANFGSATSL